MRLAHTTLKHAGCLLLATALAVGCGDDSTGNNNENTNTACEDHSDCADDQVCDPDTSLCVANTCGDGFVRDTEACDDGPDNGVSPSDCLADCTLTTCGDGHLGSTEVCDGTALDGATCTSETGHDSGDLACGDDCGYATDDCYTCGDAVLDGPEACDGTDFGGATCADHGFDGGDLACGGDCLSVVTVACTTCGDGDCEVSRGETTLTCQADCGWVNIDAGGKDGNYSRGGFSCGVKGDGTVWCWGLNDLGQLGNGTFDSTSIPVQVPLIDNALTVSIGDVHACALKADGDIDCWGQNWQGQLGTGSDLASSIPAPVFLALPAVAVSAGYVHTCAEVDDAGEISTMCWGQNGRLGIDAPDGSNFPVPMGTPEVRGVSAGGLVSCGIHVGFGAAMCWGWNFYGALGDGTLDNHPTPIFVNPPNLLSVSQVGTGDHHSCALLPDGTVSCWGDNGPGALGTRPEPTWGYSYVPVPVDGLSGETVSQLSVGFYTSCVVTDNHDAYCWGENGDGQRGDGTTDNNYDPMQAWPVVFSPPTSVSSITSGMFHTCAIGTDGRVYCWGCNLDGELGFGTSGDDVPVPTLVVDPYL